MILVGVFLVLALYYIYKVFYFQRLVSYGKSMKGLEGRRLLLVTAHPDDECMFFGPMILSYLEGPGRRSLHLLCLSAGDFNGKGSLRKSELWRAAGRLGIPPTSITLIKHDHLPDSPTRIWPTELLSKTVLSYVHKYSIDTLVTFDEKGVSGHANHKAINRAVVQLCRRGDLPPSCRVFELESVNFLRKYLFFFIDGSMALWSHHIAISDSKQQFVIWEAMKHHASQLVWFRYLYCTFSRYMILNTFKEISVSRKEE